MITLDTIMDASSHRGVPIPRNSWNHPPCPEYIFRDLPVLERITLPPIREAFPELREDVPPESARTPPSAMSPARPSPEYLYSPIRAKRRRNSAEEGSLLDRTCQVPRFYHSSQAGSRPQSPTSRSYPPSAPAYSNSSSPSSRVMDLGSLRTPPLMEPHDPNPNHRTMFFVRAVTAMMGKLWATQTAQHDLQQRSLPGSRATRHSNRPQSLSVGSAPFDSVQYTTSGYMPPYQDQYLHMNDLAMGTNGEVRPRRRRGNLPKETTDKLRSWFMSHLAHPYPTEDEKQELMRQTDLQLNQISNWFINARRRQLPALISSAEAERGAAAAMESRAMNAPVERETTRHVPRRNPHSDSEMSYEEPDVDPDLQRPRKKRGSI
ncbi:hypothetical protein RRF57_003393 [Xylaria bambusicola]|uniref:Homeobox domain-containing protein n=1 Tax=Xylaria bambusicola TaxID=326684 RepID=A0AAN7UH21_9PEZI